MALLRRIASRVTSSSFSKIMISSLSYFRRIPLPSGHGCCRNYINHKTHHWPKFAARNPEIFPLFPSILVGFLGLQLVDIAFSDSNEEAMKNSMQPESLTDYSALEKLAREERRRLEELIKRKGMFYGSYPKFSVAVKGKKVTIKFQIPKTCDVSHLIASLVLNSGVKVENGPNSEMIVGAWNSAAAWQVTLHNPAGVTDTEENGEPTENSDLKGSMFILLFGPLLSSEKSEIEFIKEGSFSTKELEAIAAALKIGGGKMNVEIKQRGERGAVPFEDKSITNLEALGVRVFGLDESPDDSSNREISWENIAGYDQQKREIEDTIVMALHRPEVYDDIARGTRSKFESNRPKAVLFEGPPGTGKTSSARVIAHQAGVPMLYVPLEVIMSKYYGESERLLGKVFLLANELPNGAIIFLDEVDSFAVARDTDMHEATRRILSILLRQIDGFEQDKKVVVIAATNRKQDLDPALISRFDSIITFDLPDSQNREAIAAQYAKQLSKSQLSELAEITQGMSGRDIRDVCQQAERHWASKMIRSGANTGEIPLPPLQLYIESAVHRKKTTDVQTSYRRAHAKVL